MPPTHVANTKTQRHEARPSTRFARRSRRLTQIPPTRPDFLNAKTQRREGAKPARPFLTQRRRGAEAQRTSERASSDGEVLAVSRRPGTAGRDTTPKTRFRRDVPPSGLRLESAGLASPLLQNSGNTHIPPPQEGTRQAEPTRHRRGGRWDDRARRTLAFGAVGRPTGGR